MWYTLVHVFVVVCLLACGRLTAAAVADLTTDTQFREAIEQPDRVILVDFYAVRWCNSVTPVFLNHLKFSFPMLSRGVDRARS